MREMLATPSSPDRGPIQEGPDKDHAKGILATLEKRLPPETAQRIHQKYQEILKAADGLREYLRREFEVKTTLPAEELKRIESNLIVRAEKALFESLGAGDAEGVTENVLEKLQNVRAETILFTDILRTLKQRGERLSLEQVRELSLSIVLGPELRATRKKDAEQMATIYAKNYAGHPAKFKKSLLEGFEASMRRPGTRFFVLKKGDEVIAFNRFDKPQFNSETGKESVYFGAFNVDPNYRGSSIGEIMMEKSLDEESKTHVLRADCDPTSPAAMNYIERGFVADRFYDYEGVPSLSIEWDRVANRRYSKGQEKAVFMEVVEQSEDLEDVWEGSLDAPNGQNHLVVFASPDTAKIPFNLLDEGYVLTRYFKSKSSELAGLEGFTFAIFERPYDPRDPDLGNKQNVMPKRLVKEGGRKLEREVRRVIRDRRKGA